MDTPPKEPFQQPPRDVFWWIVFAAGLFSLLGGVLSLLGWALRMPVLVDWLRTDVTIKANAAVCATLSGFALLAAILPFSRWLVRISACTIFLIAFLTLLQNLLGVDFGIDTLLTEDVFGMVGSIAPGRMGIPGSTSFTLISIGLLATTFNSEFRRAASLIGLVATGISLFSIVGYTYGASSLYAIPSISGIAFQTATMILAVGIGLVLVVHDHGLGAALRRPDAGGLVLRRLLLPTILIPFAIGWIRVQGERAGLYDSPFGTSLYLIVTVSCTIGLVAWCAGGIGRLSEAERQSREALSLANAELERRVEERTADLVTKIEELEGFCYAVSHDMRAPLRGIVSNARIILDEESHRLEPTGQERLQALANAAKKMALLIDDLLAYARLGQAVPNRQLCNLSELADRTVEEVLLDHGVQDAMVTIKPGMLRVCDQRLFGLVLHNLVDNAAKYRSKDKHLEVEIGEMPDGSIFVRDNGIGFDMRYIDRIFKPFERLHRDVEYAGNGIGLANVQRIVERHGGVVWAESEGPGRGATFYVSVERAETPVPEPAQVA